MKVLLKSQCIFSIKILQACRQTNKTHRYLYSTIQSEKGITIMAGVF